MTACVRGGLLSDIFLHLVPHSFLGESEGIEAKLVPVEEKRNILIRKDDETDKAVQVTLTDVEGRELTFGITKSIMRGACDFSHMVHPRGKKLSGAGAALGAAAIIVAVPLVLLHGWPARWVVSDLGMAMLPKAETLEATWQGYRRGPDIEFTETEKLWSNV
ncbi:hypothetical protein K439DRAFT_1556646 [Ramaria rubella]|nr:hypothetical protein K439DRAFT_1556646 [Ramaria rubella]